MIWRIMCFVNALGYVVLAYGEIKTGIDFTSLTKAIGLLIAATVMAKYAREGLE